MTHPQSRQIPISEALRMGIEHQQAGRLRQAEEIYRAVLAAEPAHPGARYNLGLIALQSGRAQQALPVLKEALQANPDNAAFWMNYAAALAGSGDMRAARDVLLQARSRGLGGAALTAQLQQLERAIGTSRAATGPDLSALLRLYEAGQFAAVEQQARQLRQSSETSAQLARLLGSALLAQEKFELAAEVLGEEAARFGNDPHLHFLHGVALRQLDRRAAAQQALLRSLALAPDGYEALLNASANAVLLRDPEEARRHAARAAALRPDDARSLLVSADAAAAGGALDEAIELYRRAVALDPRLAEAHANLADALTDRGRCGEAVAAAERALALRPDDARAHMSLGRALSSLGETAAAARHFRRASDLAPRFTEAHTAYLFSLSHDDTVTPQHSFAEHLRIGDLIEAPLRSLRFSAYDNERDPERGLRVGFVSGDLREHAMAYLLEPIWRAMRGGRHRIYAYANQAVEDAVSARLRALADAWRRVERLDDEALCARIRADRIDVLFDLSGHTVGNRLTVFARKPAPLQVTWMGYPATSGLSAIDYRWLRGVGKTVAAAGDYFREKVVFFRYRGFEPEPNAPAVAPLPALRNGYVTFGSFNRTSKISEATVDLWSKVLHAVPGARMLIGAAGEERTQQRLRALFALRGIAAERIEFRPRVPMHEYLALHGEVDIALDTFPYTGGTTTSHALWMGVPVLTLVGAQPQQTQAAGILSLVGMGDWATITEAEFVERAAAAARDPEALSRLRLGLRPAMARRYEETSDMVAREVDTALQTMWRRWCAGLPPAGFTVEI